MTKRDTGRWVIDTSEDGDPPRLAPRFRNVAVRRLGYTQTEAGMRTLSQILAELEDLCEMEKEAREGPQDDSWLDEEGEE